MLSTLTYARLVKSVQELKRAIVEHKHAKKRLARSARDWLNTFDATDDAIWILDGNQRILRCNKSSELLFRRSSEEMINRYCWEVLHGAKKPAPGCPFQRAIKGLKRESLELQVARNRFRIVVDPILDEDGKYNGAIHIVSDITQT